MVRSGLAPYRLPKEVEQSSLLCMDEQYDKLYLLDSSCMLAKCASPVNQTWRSMNIPMNSRVQEGPCVAVDEINNSILRLIRQLKVNIIGQGT